MQLQDFGGLQWSARGALQAEQDRHALAGSLDRRPAPAVVSGVVEKELVEESGHLGIGWSGEPAGPPVVQVSIGVEQEQLTVGDGVERRRHGSRAPGCRSRAVVAAAAAVPSGGGVPQAGQGQLLAEAVRLQQAGAAFAAAVGEELAPAQPARLPGVDCDRGGADPADPGRVLLTPVPAGRAQPLVGAGDAQAWQSRQAVTVCGACR